MTKTMIVSVFGAAVVLAAVLAATAFVATNAHEMSPSIPAAVDSSDFFLRHPEGVMARAAVDTSDYFLRHPEGVITFAGAAPVHLVAARSLYVSEATLRSRLDQAYEQRLRSPAQAQVQALLRILNGRYERRQGGLPY